MSDNANNVRSIEISPGVYRTFKVYDNYGTRSWKTYSEAVRYMTANKERWNDKNNVPREKYQYQIRVIDSSILVMDDVHINPVPPWLV